MRRRKRYSDAVEINLTPLIDVVFLLLIFFMISTTFIKENRLGITLPEASKQPPSTQDLLEIVIDREGHYFVNGRKLTKGDVATLMEALRQVQGDGGLDMTGVVISADAEASHQSVVRVLDVVGRLGYASVNLTTRVGRD